MASRGERLARAGYAAALSVLSPALARRRRYAGDPDMRRERAGWIDPPPEYRAAPIRYWVHGSSVGEIHSVPPILAELAAARPGAEVVLSAFTDTGRAAARRLAGERRAFALPLDLGRPLGRAFTALSPHALLLIETELWPGLLEAARRRQVPVAILNGRLSARSAARYRTLRPLLGHALRDLVAVAAQSEVDAERFAGLGVPGAAIAVCGSSKFDVAPEPAAAAPPRPIASRPVVVAGSTHPGDEALVLDALDRLAARRAAPATAPAPTPFLIIAPRHVERVGEVEALLMARGRRSARRSASPGPLAAAVDRGAAAGADVLLLDSLGELAPAYALAWVAVVGGGFGAGRGGHNLLEAAARGRPVVCGRGHRGVAGEVDLLVAAGGGWICAGAEEVARVLAPLLADPARAAAAGSRARSAVDAARGASRRAVRFVLERLDGGPSGGERLDGGRRGGAR